MKIRIFLANIVLLFGQMFSAYLLSWQIDFMVESYKATPLITSWMIMSVSIFGSLLLFHFSKQKVTKGILVVSGSYILFQAAVLWARYLQGSNSRIFLFSSAVMQVIFLSYLYLCFIMGVCKNKSTYE